MTDQTPGGPAEAPAVLVAEVKLVMRILAMLTALVVLFSFAQDITGRRYGYVRLMDVSEEACPLTWMTSVTLLGAALVALHTAFLHRLKGVADWKLWGLIGATLMALSAEEVVGVHDRLAMKIDRLLYRMRIDYHMAWAGPALVLCGLLFVAVLPYLRALPARTLRLVLAAAAVYVLAAAGTEFLQGILYIFMPLQAAPMVVLNHLEEAMEQAGAMMMLWAMVDYRAHEAASVEI